MTDDVDAVLKKEQARFRKDPGFIDQIQKTAVCIAQKLESNALSQIPQIVLLTTTTRPSRR